MQSALVKSELKAEFLQRLSQKTQGQGFTLIELLVVVVIFGILASVAIPAYVNQTAKARGAEAKSHVGSINRAQQAYYLENQQFTTTVSDLGISTPNQTNNFSYSIQLNNTITTGVTDFGTSRSQDIKSYAGGVFHTTGALLTVLCEANGPGATPVAIPTAGTPPTCGANSNPTN